MAGHKMGAVTTNFLLLSRQGRDWCVMKVPRVSGWWTRKLRTVDSTLMNVSLPKKDCKCYSFSCTSFSVTFRELVNVRIEFRFLF